MDSRSAHVKHLPVLAARVLAAVFFAQIQYEPLRAGQPILFSSPTDDTVSSNLPSLSPRPLEPLDFGNNVKIPSPFDLNGPPIEAPPLPGPLTISPAAQAQLLDLSDRRKNWMFLTPAEILGTTTPEKILGIQERDAFGQPKNSTALERYTARQDQKLSATNAFRNGKSSSVWDSSRNRQDQSDGFHPNHGEWEDLASKANSLFNSAADDRTGAGQSPNSDGSKLFGSPTPSPAPNTAQQMSMERFRQLLGSSSSPAPAPTPSANDKLFSLPGMSPEVKPGQSSLNPMGGSFTPLNSGVGKPADLPALPSAWGLSYTSSRPAAAWVPQPPPWMSPDPQPFAVPQRKF